MLGAVPATPDNLKQIAYQTAIDYGVDPALVYAHIQVESSWNPQAMRNEPAIQDASWGLMQILLKTAKSISGNPSLTATQLLDPAVNIAIGVKYIAQQLARYGGNIQDAIAAYNAGSAKKYADGTYMNQDYVDKVMKWYKIYKAELAVSGAAEQVAQEIPGGLPILGIIALGAVVGLLILD